MKTWERYKEFLHKGQWHIHTSYTDGENTVDEYCRMATDLEIPLLAFTEHVRKNLDYDFNAFLSDIDLARGQYDLIILSGIEAKVLLGGELDVEDSILKEVDYPIFAYHSFPVDIKQYLDSLKKIIINPHINTWAHPGLFLKKHNLRLTKNELNMIFLLLKENRVLLEVNDHYNLPLTSWRNSENYQWLDTIKGSDIHRIDQLSNH